MYIKRLAENLVQKALLLFEILSFEVYWRSDRLPDSTIRGVGIRIRTQNEPTQSADTKIGT